MDPELQALIEKGIAAGYSDEDIKSLAEEHARRKTSQLTVMPNATTIQQDPSGPVKRVIDTALYNAKGVPGIVAGGVKNVVGGVNSVLDLASGGRARIPINTEPSNQDQRLGDVAATAAQLAPLAFGAVKGAEAAVPVATRMARAAAPVVGGAAGAAEGYRRHGVLGALEGGVIGTAGGGYLGRLMRRVPGGAPGVVKAAEEALMTPEAVMGKEAAAKRAWEMRRSGESTPGPVAAPGSMGGPLANPKPVPNPQLIAVHDSQAIKDMMRPEAQAFIESEFKANNPIFRQMQGEGQFGPSGVDEATRDLVNRLRTRMSPTTAPTPVAEAVPQVSGRGVTPAVAEKLANQHTPGWHDVSLEDLMKQREMAARPAPVKRPSAVEPVESMNPASSEDATYYRLKVKPHLTGEEQAIFNKLEAKRRGTAFAAGRKP